PIDASCTTVNRLMFLPSHRPGEVPWRAIATKMPFLPVDESLEAENKRHPKKTAPKKPSVDDLDKALANEPIDYSDRQVDVLLRRFPAENCDYDWWIKVGMALFHQYRGSTVGFDRWDKWSAQDDRYDQNIVRSKWRSFGGERSTPITLRTIIKEAPPAREFFELKQVAEALPANDLDALEEIVAECSSLTPVRREAIFKTIKRATGVSLGSLRDQCAQESGLKSEPDHLDLARMTLAHIGLENILCSSDRVWQWSEKGVWKIKDERALKRDAQNLIDKQNKDVNVIASRVNGVIDVLKSEIFKPDHEFNCGDPDTVNCLNGELTCDGLKPHRREHYRTTQIPVEYDRDAKAPMFEAFLDQVFRDDADRDMKTYAVLELIGYSLMSHARHEIFVLLIGSGANGKSVLLGVLEGLLGSTNVAGVQPSNFDNRFQRAHLDQKLANIVTELRQGEVIADAELKAITSGEPATVEHKFQNPFVMRPFATCWFGTNHMPHTRDFSEALFRRATILRFNRKFDEHEQDPMLKTKLLTELPGILKLATDAYFFTTVLGFTAPRSSVVAKDEWKLEADQVAQFVDEVCEADPANEEQMEPLYRRYEYWADEVGISRKVTMKTLRDRLTTLGFGARRTAKCRFVTGLRISSTRGGL
ncbi:MAG: phage/plasmid primase, P4 family, partial [Paracoccaceae bacterium]|nr:phage/plasmid primase, P4 family [Paracoccaceae bacterium]